MLTDEKLRTMRKSIKNSQFDVPRSLLEHVSRIVAPALLAEVERLRAEMRKAYNAGFADGTGYQHASEVHDWGPAPQYSDYKERGWNKFLKGDE